MIVLNRAKNLIINGAFDFWQRGTSFSIGLSSLFTADRFSVISNGNLGIGISRDTGKPTFEQAKFNLPCSLRINNMTASIPVAGVFNTIGQKIEGYLYQTIHGKVAVFSFWVKCTHVGNFPISFRNSANTRSYVTSFTVNEINTWEKKVIPITMDNTIDWSLYSGIGLYADFTLCSTITHYASQMNTWLSGMYLSHSSLNLASAFNGFNMYIAGVQLEQGTEESNFDRSGGSYINEQLLVQRYYEKSYDMDVNPGTVVTWQCGSRWVTSLTNYAQPPVAFKVNKRISPTVVLYDFAGNINRVRINGADNNTNYTILQATQKHFVVNNTVAATEMLFGYTADAEL